MKITAILVLTASAVLFQVAQRPVVPARDHQVSLDNPCTQVGRSLPGVATQGGYRFDYESLKGNDCRDYRLANTPGHQSVKVKWQYPSDKLDPVLCEVKLANCLEGQECPPFDCPKDTGALEEARRTDLGYGGPNADSYTDHPDAYVTQRDLSEPYSMRTILQGTVGDTAGKPMEIAVEVTSAVVGRQPPYHLTYSIRTTAKSRPLNIWSSETKPTPTDVVVRWETAESEEFFAAIRRQGAFRLSSDRLAANVEILANSFARASKLLVVTQGDEIVASASAPAYVVPR